METGVWTSAETEHLARAVLGAPSVHNLQPWLLDLAPGRAWLRERGDLVLPHHDPDGRDRAASCGAAVVNLELAVRTLGRAADVVLLPNEHRPEIVARVDAHRSSAPTHEEVRLHRAIAHRTSHRRPFGLQPVRDSAARRVVSAARTLGVDARLVTREPDIAAVAKLLHVAAEKFQADSGYQRELSLWTIRDEATHRHGVGIPAGRIPAGAVPWAGLVRRATEVPHWTEIEERLAAGVLVVLVTPGDTRLDHLRAGYALELAWLTAVDLGLVGAVLTQPLHLETVRAKLGEELSLTGVPQVLVRIGHSSESEPPRVRRSTEELVQHVED
ncbi:MULTISPECIES: nitroreductase [unclassified Amycolatopsis]|uniref:Acg family FMN-binding oxidoreductase n=1 Tax=unclassified Amycolatopsis TaxID=2618356 RepID=UPI001C6A158A|nr:nitroreductase [Amycolatopsis sp. DSM 110486]QYN20333.1 nitroreductase [Amycolatopsis sp. DSM 110486]